MKEKTVFKSSEIAHLWANGKESGRCPSNMRFDGGGFYSYATCIARRGVNKGVVYFILDTASFSSSTSNHQRTVRAAIASGSVVFRINSGRRGQSLILSPKELRDFYLEKWNQPPSTSRFAHTRAQDLINRARNLDEAIRVSKFFGLGCSKLEKIRNTIAATLESEWEVLQAHNEKLQDRREALAEKRRIQRKTREAASIAEAINRAEKLIAGERFLTMGSREDYFGGSPGWNQDYLLDSRPDLKVGITQWREARNAKDHAAWLAGADIYASRDWPTCARVEGNEVVSNLGARIPLESALLGLKFVFAKRKTGWHRNGEQFPLGDYQLDAVNEFGIVAGCHTVKWDELERLAIVLKQYDFAGSGSSNPVTVPATPESRKAS